MFRFPGKIRIALVAPSGGCDAAIVAAGRKVLEACGCEVKIMPHVFAGTLLPYLAADDDCRAADINSALADESVDMLWAVRGGYGAMRILDAIDWQLWRQQQKALAGFSDITALHWAMARNGCGNFIAAPMMKYLGSGGDVLSADTLFQALSEKNIFLKLAALRAGNISGNPLPGNLAVASALCGTAYFPDTAGKIIILEEVGETPYRVDRMLTQMHLAGAFADCAGVVFGNFTDCGDPAMINAVLQDFTGKVRCPVYYGLPFGHELPFHSISGRQIISVSVH